MAGAILSAPRPAHGRTLNAVVEPDVPRGAARPCCSDLARRAYNADARLPDPPIRAAPCERGRNHVHRLRLPEQPMTPERSPDVKAVTSSIRPGMRLGPYEVLSPLGRGGMGEVWRARDTALLRDVALKVLPAAVATTPSRLARFRREAQLLASLNHPSIGAIYGFEESECTPALVLELVEGQTLANRLTRGPLALDDALRLGAQIAEALEAAHERGIVHRDLKPGQRDAAARRHGVKVLEFGLAGP